MLVKDNVDKLGHLEGTKVLFCDLQHTTLASDRGAKHTICLSVIDQVHGYHIKDCPPDSPDGRGQTESRGKNCRRLGVFVGNFIRLKIGKSFLFDIMKLNYPNSSKKQIIKEWIDVSTW